MSTETSRSDVMALSRFRSRLIVLAAAALGLAATVACSTSTSTPHSAAPHAAAPASIPSAPAAAAARSSKPAPAYELARASVRLLGALKGTVEVAAYVTKARPEVELVTQDLIEVLASYERSGQGKFRLTVIDVTTPELRQQAERWGVKA